MIEAERFGAPFLVWRDGGGEQQILSLNGRVSAMVGRSPESDIVLADGEASRAHAELRRASGEWTVEDDGLSRNGTFVNGLRIAQRRRLADGDVMRFGNTTVQYRSPRPSSGDTTTAGAHLAPAGRLTDTQKRILVALCRPYRAGAAFTTPASNSQIADEVFLGVDAVKNHLRLLYQRFDIANLPQNEKRARLVERAMQLGVVAEHDR